MINLILGGFSILSLGLWVYSYGFTDLNLTLTTHPVVVRLVSWNQKLVYFNRDLSLKVYLALVLGLFVSYAWLLYWSYAKEEKIQFPWKWLVVIGMIYTLAYPFLSHDSFKYLFAAKMVVKYQVNPHLHPPNSISNDPWLRFMRWIHTPSPYGPVFTGLTIPAYLLGLGKFTLSLFWLKGMNFFWFLISVWLIGRISHQLSYSRRQTIINQMFFGFNPLILIEGLANVHNDLPMMALLLLAIYFWFQKRTWLSLLSLLASIGIKYITVVFLPAYLIGQGRRQLVWWWVGLMLLVVPIGHYTQYQPWYIVWILTILSLVPGMKWKWWGLVYALGGMARYLPFVATGLWEASRLTFNLLTFSLPIIYLMGLGLTYCLKGKQVKHSVKK